MLARQLLGHNSSILGLLGGGLMINCLTREPYSASSSRIFDSIHLFHSLLDADVSERDVYDRITITGSQCRATGTATNQQRVVIYYGIDIASKALQLPLSCEGR